MANEVSSASFRIAFAERCSRVNCRSEFSSLCFCNRSAICFRTCASIFVGSCIASLPSTRIKLLILSFGSGGFSSPSRTFSIFSFSASRRFCRRNFLRSFFVRQACKKLKLLIAFPLNISNKIP